MEGSFSPVTRKLVGEVISKPKRSFTSPTKVCLGDWWLSKPRNEEGIAVSGRPVDFRKCDDAGSSFNLASPVRRYSSREFHSTKVVKRHGATIETCDGVLISLCGFINKSRTQENGFTSEVCRDFIHGFPFNWEDYTAQSTDEEQKSNENFIESFTPDVMDSLNAAQLHDLVLSFTDTERDLFSERVCNNLTLRYGRSPKCVLDISAANEDAKASKKQRLDTSTDVYMKQECSTQKDVQTPGAINVDDEHAL